ncbi:uncharacterized protein TRUGW13939_06241 [Talaromyces rugulosus]|uniref:Protein bimA n=1 Tax=Talaromyces rugulosus TaxID=121627 RepID=A0A7H8QYC0_TALRU|nr:uncharacterized protein TRUGW13939_06241 [Talaromyces rugulosus]QKX59110.1 hypothetical protein TRUGW13939_06241 [Talaromyces rugulosus]
MAPSTPHISGQLRQLIYYHLDNNLINNALFLAGRLHAYEPRSSESSYLLALCHLLSGQPKAAWEYSRNAGSRGTHLGCSYVLAQACLDLGKYMDGITALERSRSLWASKSHWNKHSETRRQHYPDAAAVICLQGKLWQANKDLRKAVECYVESLKLNPFMWDAFTALCEAGVNIKVSNLYKLTPELVAMVQAAPLPDSTALSDKTVPHNGPLQTQLNTNPNADPFFSNSSKGDSSLSHGSSALWEKLNGSTVSVASVGPAVIHEGMETPVAQNDPDDVRLMNGAVSSNDPWEPRLAPARRNRPLQHSEYGDPPPKMRTTALKSRIRSRAEPEDSNPVHIEEEPVPVPSIGERKRTVSGQVAHQPVPQPLEPGAPQRRSTRLLNHIRPTTSKLAASTLREGREVKKVRATGTKGRTATASSMGRAVSGNRKHIPSGPDGDGKESRPAGSSNISNMGKSAAPDRTKEIEALSWILDLFAKLATGCFNLARYKCPEAIQTLNLLPQGQRETPWVLSQIGRAYYEQALYTDAEKYFIRVKTLAPFRLEDMEIYSTVLWHLKHDVELSYLAHELMEADRLSPEAWCAAGNSFSHQRDHEQALKCFKRATQLNPRFAYAFALQGHEYVANEEYDKALDAFRSGINADNRHYNSWYGLGQVYEKMGKLEYAEQHYRNAVQINPSNAVLICCIGLVIEKMSNPKTALFHYSRATSLAPQSVLARFRKARVLMKLEEFKLALAELKVLKDIAPDEANVHYLLGKLYKVLQDKANAIKHFTAALNLDPKAAQYIKDAMEALDDDEDDADMA